VWERKTKLKRLLYHDFDRRKAMDERFTDEVRRAKNNAKMDASLFGSAKIETEHLLLGILREDSALLDRFLTPESSSVSIREDILSRISFSKQIAATSLINDFADSSSRALLNAAKEADQMGSEKIGIEHLLLGLLCEEDCLAAELLRKHGVSTERVKNELLAVPHNAPSLNEKKRRAIETIRMGLVGTAFPNLRMVSGESSIIERFTDKALASIFFALSEARKCGSTAITSEHLLLALLREDGLHLNQFLLLADSREDIRRRIEEHSIVRESGAVSAELPISEECLRVLVSAGDEAIKLGHERIRLAHLLLGLLREKDSFAAKLLQEHGAEIERIRIGLKASPKQPPSNPAAGGPVIGGKEQP
jgi:ATP-dependent Clp protease ATP-binding subunit ClpA